MAMAANDPNTVYVGSFNGGIYKTTDGAANWAVTGERTNITLTLAIDPFNANVVYAGYNGSPAIRKSTDGGATWVAASTGHPEHRDLRAGGGSERPAGRVCGQHAATARTSPPMAARPGSR